MFQDIKIVVVDDEESLCELMAEILSEQYQVFKAFNGKEALAVIRENKPDLVISDIMMPHMTGLEMLSILRREEVTRHLPVILLSAAYSPAGEILKQVTAFITKPFEIETLESLVDEAINQQEPELFEEEPQQDFKRIHQLGEANPYRSLQMEWRKNSYFEKVDPNLS